MMNNATYIGGAVRDTLLGRPVRDFDVLVPSFVGPVSASGSRSISDVSGSGSISDRPCLVVGGYDIQVGDDPIGHMANFTVDLCKVGYDGQFIVSEEFLRDVRDRAITFTPSPIWSMRKQLAHLEKVRAKYPDFRLRAGNGFNFTRVQ
jgi:hypothetical protein